jgi:Flp pilus assembly protein TadG
MVHHPHNTIKDTCTARTPALAGGARECRCEVRSRKYEKQGHKFHPSSFILLPSECGAVAVEMVFFLLIFVVTFFGAVEMAREVSVKHALDVGTYRAARYLSIVPSDQATARNMIQTELDSNVLGGAGSVQMTVDMPSQSFQAVFSVTAQVPYQPVVPLIIFAPKTLSVTHSQSIEAYP